MSTDQSALLTDGFADSVRDYCGAPAEDRVVALHEGVEMRGPTTYVYADDYYAVRTSHGPEWRSTVIEEKPGEVYEAVEVVLSTPGGRVYPVRHRMSWDAFVRAVEVG